MPSTTGSAPANVTTTPALQGGQLNGSASNQSNVWMDNTLFHFKVSHMDGSTIISPIVPNSRQTPNISALCDTSETQWCGIRLQTAASKPHGPIPFGFPMPLQPSIPKSSPEGGKSSISHTDSLSTRNKPSISWRWLVGICISYILRTNDLPEPLGHCGIQN